MRYLFRSILLLLIVAEPLLAATHIIEQLPNGLRVNAEYRPAKQGKATVLLVHPLQQTYNFPTIKNLADSLSEEGYGVLIPNLSLGISDRKLRLECESIHTHTLEQDIDEVDFWINWLSRTTSTPIIAIGHSTGALQAAGYRDSSLLHALVLVSLVTIGPEGAASIDTDQLEQARNEQGLGTQDQLGQYKFSYCNNYVTLRNVYLEIASWDEQKVSRKLASKSIPVHIIFGDEDYTLNSPWLSELNKPNVFVHHINGSNHFFSGLGEFELHEKVLEILQTR